MFQPNNQPLREEHERRVALVLTWVLQFPREGRTERELDRHIQRELGVSRMTSYTYRRAARERLGAALPDPAHLAGLLVEWGEQSYDEIERSRMTSKEKIKLRTALIATLAKLAPKHVVWAPPAEAPPFSPEEQARFLSNGEQPPCDP